MRRPVSVEAVSITSQPGSVLTIPTTGYAIDRLTLPNGLRVILSTDRSAPVLGVAVLYDVGIRSEPEGRSGFAHLFEHLMFQGSENLEKLAHFRYVQASGGVFNGSTHLDYTDYYQTLPSNALERALFLEADRMRMPLITAENMENQIAVVKEEIRVNVKNRPYGGFPWILLPPVMFDTFPNAHDGYGSFADLDAATVDDAVSFFNTYYAPGNAVLSVGGDIDVDETIALIERHFGDITARPVPTRPSFAEPDLTSERRTEHADALAPMPALAMGWRVPDPIDDVTEYLPYAVLAEVLTDGDASRLVERLILDDAIATSVSGYVSFMGEPFDVRDPTAILLQVHYPPQVSAEQVVRAVDEEIDRLANGGFTPGELERVKVRLAAHLLREGDAVLGRILAMAVLEQQRGRAEWVNDLPRMVGEVTPEQVIAAAAKLRPERRAVLEIVPGGSK